MGNTLGKKMFGVEPRTTLMSAFLVANPLIWYYAVIIFLERTINDLPFTNTDLTIFWGLHFFGIVVTAIVGATLYKKIEQKKLLTIWMLTGSLASLSLIASGTTSTTILCIIALTLGASLGFGMPMCMSCFTHIIPIESRGRVSGIVMFITGLGLFAFSITPISNLLLLGVTLGLWRLSSIFVLRRLNPPEKKDTEVTTYKSIITQQSFVLYFAPWVMFCLVNYLGSQVQVDIVGEATVAIMAIIQNAMLGIFAVVGGFLLDKIGRKRMAIAGFVMLGIDTASLGLIPATSVWINYTSAVIDGIAWGFLLVIFIVTIWGDLSNNVGTSKFYAMGVAPFFISKFLEFTIGENLSRNIVDGAGKSGLFSFLAFFLFLAVLPLVYAPETLPERVMKSRDLKSYAEKAMKKLQKENEKNQKKDFATKPESSIENEPDSESEENSDEYEQARKLAEKYY
ncbi:MAG: MFS transporter [Candidatus Bathyarchaeia archaeon]|jgi:MFS family permease